MKPYIIVYQSISNPVDVACFEAEVNRMIEQGYTPQGGVSDSGQYFTQAMFKKPTKTTKPGSSKSEYPDWFEKLWARYPKRAGNNPKAKAWQAARVRAKEVWPLTGGVDGHLYAMSEGVDRYARFCEATNKVGTEFVMMASTFFGPSKPYLQSWDIPVQKITVPADDAMLESFAVEHGMHTPGNAPQHLRNAYEYRKWIEGKL